MWSNLKRGRWCKVLDITKTSAVQLLVGIFIQNYVKEFPTPSGLKGPYTKGKAKIEIDPCPKLYLGLRI